MKRKYRIILLLAAIIVFLLLLFKWNEQEGTFVYNFEIRTGDMVLRDFTIISTQDSIYIPSGYYIERITGGEIRDISATIDSGKKHIWDVVFQFDHLKRQEDDFDYLLPDMTLSPDENLVVTFKYKIDGKEKEYYESVDLNQHIKFQSAKKR